MPLDWNIADSVPPEHRTYIRMVDDGTGTNYVRAFHPESVSTTTYFNAEELEGSYVLVGVDVIDGYVEIRTRFGTRWWVREDRIEEVPKSTSSPHKFKDSSNLTDPEPTPSLEDQIIKALNSPRVRQSIFRIVRHQLTIYFEAQSAKKVVSKYHDYWSDIRPYRRDKDGWGY